MSRCAQCGSDRDAFACATAGGRALCFQCAREYLPVLPEDEPGHAGEPVRPDTFPLLGFSDLLTLPDPAWMIEGIVPEDGLTVVFGQPGSYKSFLALDLALCVATGCSWFGRKAKLGYVVYVAAEGSGGLKRRCTAWWKAHRQPDMSRAKFLPSAVNLLADEQVERTRRTLNSLPERPRLLVIDTMSRCLVGGDENAARDVGMFIASVDGLRAPRAAMVVHHAGWDGKHERGSSALRGAADLTVKTKRDHRRVDIVCDKAKDFEPWATMTLAVEPFEDSCVLSLVHDAGGVKLDDLRERILAHVREHGPVGRADVEQAVGGRAENVRETLDGLVVDGVLTRSGSGHKGAPHRYSKPSQDSCPDPPDTNGHESAEAAGGFRVPSREGDYVSPAGTRNRSPVEDACPADTNPSGHESDETPDAVEGLALLDAFEAAITALDEPETLDALIRRKVLDPLLDAFDAEEVTPEFWHWAEGADGKLHQVEPDGGSDCVDVGSAQHGRWLVVSEEARHRDLHAVGYRTVAEVAELLDCSTQKVHALRKAGELRPAVDVGKGTRPWFMVAEVARYLGRPIDVTPPPAPATMTADCIRAARHAGRHRPHPTTGRPVCWTCHPPPVGGRCST